MSATTQTGSRPATSANSSSTSAAAATTTSTAAPSQSTPTVGQCLGSSTQHGDQHEHDQRMFPA
jgi:hypothetical protein